MNTKIDVYLNRVSQISQLLLVCFAIFGYFYTVRPVYQNASLQESIAKKEVELKDLQKKIDSIYTNLRTELINKFLIRMTFECSPFMPLMMQPEKGDLDSPKPYETEFQEVKSLLSNNPYNCLRSKVENDPALQHLKAEDKRKLISSIESLKPIITEKFNKTLKLSEDENYLISIGKPNSKATASLEKFYIDNGITSSNEEGYYKKTYMIIGLKVLISDFGMDFNHTVTEKVKI